MRVRAVEISSKSDPWPNRSRSATYGMRVIQESLARFAVAGPLPVQPRQRIFVVRHGPAGGAARAQHALMRHDQADEHRRGQPQPEPRQIASRPQINHASTPALKKTTSRKLPMVRCRWSCRATARRRASNRSEYAPRGSPLMSGTGLDMLEPA
jgi:hypothetical protein